MPSSLFSLPVAPRAPSILEVVSRGIRRMAITPVLAHARPEVQLEHVGSPERLGEHRGAEPLCLAGELGRVRIITGDGQCLASSVQSKVVIAGTIAHHLADGAA